MLQHTIPVAISVCISFLVVDVVAARAIQAKKTYFALLSSNIECPIFTTVVRSDGHPITTTEGQQTE